MVGSRRRCRHAGRRRLGREVFAGVDEAIALDVVLLVVALTVSSTLVEQLLVRAALHDLAALEHQNLIGARIVDNRWAMTNVVRPCRSERNPS